MQTKKEESNSKTWNQCTHTQEYLCDHVEIVDP